MNTTTVWIATVDTRYAVTAVDTDPELAVTKACEAALEFFVANGDHRYDTADEIREDYGVTAYAVVVGTAVVVANAQHHR